MYSAENKVKGYIQVYTGDGKGKTTAAIGLVIRAVGAGKNVFFAQFMKGKASSEIKALKLLGDAVTIRRYGRENFIFSSPGKEDIRIAAEGLREVKKNIISGTYDVVILDEANVAVYYNLFTVPDLLDVIDSRPGNVELVITGRNAAPEIIAKADLVTEMREVKHYFSKGVKARKGIEL
ncbi:MAG: cob(I)yrinic acid a,c-diamide adenosyltransferase [Candidatus Latescibacteria bacterium]|nr:cob(I)yrinic acid a,c-diamide adenosyltransferase [Candidatus Latescibacterota bacterium]